jgi:CheY-like chemotaxis protein
VSYGKVYKLGIFWRNMGNETKKILVVEDQSGPRMALQCAIKQVVPGHWPGFDEKRDVDYKACYVDAQDAVNQGSYNLILLDHRMPYENVGDLERTDFDRFCKTLGNMGYGLIPEIRARSPRTIIIGTSSLSSDELREFQKPDFTMRKMYDKSDEDLERILRQIESLKGGEC